MEGPTCRFEKEGLILDAMPILGGEWGEANRWYELAYQTAEPMKLADDVFIRVISGPCFVATKLEAFRSPSRSHAHDLLASHDFEDILRVLDGRLAIVAEVQKAPEPVREFLRDEFAQIQTAPDFPNALSGVLERGREAVVRERLRQMFLLA